MSSCMHNLHLYYFSEYSLKMLGALGGIKDLVVSETAYFGILAGHKTLMVCFSGLVSV